MTINFWRHATFVLEVGGVEILVDPMLSAKEAMDPVKISRNTNRIPMVDNPLTEEQLLKSISIVDAVMVTHLHRDHWDAKAQQLIPKDISIICQPSDEETLSRQGFIDLIPVNNSIDFAGLKIYRTGGQHGTGDIGIKMGHVSGFVIEYENKKIYIAGDTIWCAEVQQALETYKPDFIVLNTGAAQFDEGGPITMTAEDVIQVMKASPDAIIIAVHMDTINHCKLTRADLKKILDEKAPGNKVLIPKDGEEISLK